MSRPTRDRLAAAEARVSDVLVSKWTLRSLLGAGGVAAVYEASHRNGKRVAIKILHEHLAHDETVRTRFLREAYVANSIAHPGVVQLDDDDVDADGVPFLVMELVRGSTLETLRREQGGQLSADELLPLLAQLLDVLIVAHGQGVVHRDLKPENLMVDEGGRLRVLDFGLARAMETELEKELTQPGAILGTPSFMAPEQALGRWELVDERTDLWAVGAICYTALTGQHVHEGATAQEVLALAGTAPATPIAEVADSIPPALAAFIDEALVYAKADRPADARTMLDTLHREVAPALNVPLPQPSQTLVPSPSTAPPASPRAAAELQSANAGSAPGTSSGWSPRIISGLSLAVAGVALAASWQSRSSSTEPAPTAPAPSVPATAAVPQPSATEKDAATPTTVAPPAPSTSSITPTTVMPATAPTAASTPAVGPRVAAPRGATRPRPKRKTRMTREERQAQNYRDYPNCSRLRDLYCQHPESWLCKSTGLMVTEMHIHGAASAAKNEARCIREVPGAADRAKAELEEKAKAEATAAATPTCAAYQQRACAAEKSRGSYARGFCIAAKKRVREAAKTDNPAQACQVLQDNFVLALTDHEQAARDREAWFRSNRYRRPLPF